MVVGVGRGVVGGCTGGVMVTIRRYLREMAVFQGRREIRTTEHS